MRNSRNRLALKSTPDRSSVSVRSTVMFRDPAETSMFAGENAMLVTAGGRVSGMEVTVKSVGNPKD